DERNQIGFDDEIPQDRTHDGASTTRTSNGVDEARIRPSRPRVCDNYTGRQALFHSWPPHCVTKAMIAAPWYLFSLGISLFIVAKILKMLEESKRGERIQIDPNMSDAEIARRLKGSSAISVAGIFALTGLLCVFISLAWRVLRFLL